MSRDPNRPERGASLRDGDRNLGGAASGNAGRDGYTVAARRPRTSLVTESVDPVRAERIERAVRDIPAMDEY